MMKAMLSATVPPLLALGLLVVLPIDTVAFVANLGGRAPSQNQNRPTPWVVYADSWDSSTADGPATGGAGSIEQIEFKIYPDGRVEETVRGVKGNNCHKVTEKINEALGKVVDTSPTEEMFEEKVQVQQKIYESESDWEGSSSW